MEFKVQFPDASSQFDAWENHNLLAGRLRCRLNRSETHWDPNELVLAVRVQDVVRTAREAKALLLGEVGDPVEQRKKVLTIIHQCGGEVLAS